MDEHSEILHGLTNVERWNDQFRQPNSNGRYPICKPTVGDRQGTCARCGTVPDPDDRKPCSAIPRSQRWGEDYVTPDAVDEIMVETTRRAANFPRPTVADFLHSAVFGGHRNTCPKCKRRHTCSIVGWQDCQSDTHECDQCAWERDNYDAAGNYIGD